jgi:DNA polymerase-3 subunit epsilon
MKAWLKSVWPWRGAAPGQAVERWLVLDVETTGLDVHRDQLLAIAAMGVRVDWSARRIALQPADSLAVTLRPTQVSDKANILVHGIGVGLQRQGVDPAQAMRTFAQWAQGARLVAFHASFDRTLLQRYAREHLGRTLEADWLDIAHLCTVSHPQVKARALDDWLTHFNIPCVARHEATADVMAECDLLQRIWPQVARECGSWRAVQRYAGRHAWLGPP